MTPPLAVTDADAVIDAAWFAAHSGRTCYARAAHGWVLVVRQVTAGTRPAASAIADMGAIGADPGGRGRLPDAVGVASRA